MIKYLSYFDDPSAVFGIVDADKRNAGKVSYGEKLSDCFFKHGEAYLIAPSRLPLWVQRQIYSGDREIASYDINHL